MHEHGLTHALTLTKQAHMALAEAAPVIWQTNDYDKPAYAATRLEAGSVFF